MMEKKIKKALCYLVVSLIVLIVALPLYLTVVTAFKSSAEISADFFAPPKTLYLDNFQKVLFETNFLMYLRNSVILSVLTVVVIAVFSPMVSYSIARNMEESKIYKGLYYLFVMLIFVPSQVIIIPLTLQLSKIGLNNPVGLSLCYVTFSLAQAIFLYVGYIKSVPIELEESAMMDGASAAKIFFEIVFPLIMPMTATVVILNFLWIWNDFLMPMMLLNKEPSTWTMPLFIFNFKSQYGFEANLAFTAVLLNLLPITIVYLFLQRYIVEGLTAGAVKT